MKKICCFCEIWADGGIETMLINLLEQMDRTGLEIVVVAAEVRSEFLMPRLLRCGVRLEKLGTSTRHIASNHREFRRLLARERFDVVHLNIYQGLSMLYALDAKSAGVPVRIAHSHNSGIARRLLAKAKMLVNNLCSRLAQGSCTELWTCSDKAGKFLFHGHANVQRVNNGIDLERFGYREKMRKNTRKELGMEDNFIIGEVGRLCQQKNQLQTLQIFAEVHRLCPEARLLLAGEGPLRKMLEEEVSRLGLTGLVHFLGVIRQVPELLSALDVFVMPSLFEGLPVSLVEAQNTGLPVVCSENITRDVRLTENVTFLPLEAAPTVWAGEILRTRGVPRKDRSDTLRTAGYDIRDVAQIIRSAYLGEPRQVIL